MNKSITDSIEEQNQLNFQDELKKNHAKSVDFSDKFIVDAFPDDQATLVEVLESHLKEAAQLYKRVKYLKKITDRGDKITIEKWVFTHAEKYEDVRQLRWLYQQIKRLQRQKKMYEKKRLESQLSKEYFKTKEEKKLFDIDRMFNHENLLIEIVLYDGIRLRDSGRRHSGLCPFHNENTPSFCVYTDNWYHCYGCNAHGNFIDYLMKKHRLTFREALEEANGFL